jgi:hypothetical protein
MKSRVLCALIVPAVVAALAVPPAGAQDPPSPAPRLSVPPRSLTAHLVGHAHIDLSWRWEEMGYAERGLVLRLYEIHGERTDVSKNGDTQLNTLISRQPGQVSESRETRGRISGINKCI